MVAYNYFKEHSQTYLMHPATKEFILWTIKEANDKGFKAVKKKITKAKYEEIKSKYPNTIIVPIRNIGMQYFEVK